MRVKMGIALIGGALALVAFPALGLADHRASHGKDATAPHGKAPDPTPGPKAGLPAKAKAYGRYCKEESRKHVKGEKGTPFSRCVTAMAKAANHENMPPGRACKAESRKHVKGEKGTPFSRCVKAAAELQRHVREEEGASEGEAG